MEHLYIAYETLIENRNKHIYRLKYLLNQSDIFSHFGFGGKKLDKGEELPKPTDSKSSHRDRRGAGTTSRGKTDFDDLDDDEKEMAREEEEEDGGGSKNHNTILLKQPSIVSGGEMRCVCIIFSSHFTFCV